jgi:hypothetical protein
MGTCVRAVVVVVGERHAFGSVSQSSVGLEEIYWNFFLFCFIVECILEGGLVTVWNLFCVVLLLCCCCLFLLSF